MSVEVEGAKASERFWIVQDGEQSGRVGGAVSRVDIQRSVLGTSVEDRPCVNATPWPSGPQMRVFVCYGFPVPANVDEVEGPWSIQGSLGQPATDAVEEYFGKDF